MQTVPLNQQVAVLTLRLLLGFIFLMQGYGKVFTYTVDGIYQMAFATQAYASIPKFLLLGTAYYTSYVELIGGLLLVIGLKRDYALYALASVLVLVTFGHGYAEPIWDLSHVMYRAILLIALLLLPSQWDRFSIDYYINHSRSL
ncbi:DoxX family protein [Aureispira sp. CCB-E]|uniref:DoxX family protein n=1 Tax=Aureispira sp. CCB-E TaxID=3051121 RepID=UPI00286901AA|nr:DoxX family protein [Aureispira sp. CCB-E]WMX12546.1 DoxX family protein [Aureispira sp. CCB-E]